MPFSVWWHAYLTPPASAVKFAIKATLAMLLALYIALWCDLDRPYWALISAAFLQIRPMSGMVLEKGISQLSGTLIGCVVGIAIMAAFVQAPTPALVCLTLWISVCAYAASLTRNNASYGCIMAAVTAMLIVIITASAPGGLFAIAVARLSELALGAICATLVSALLWPIQVRDHLADLADQVVNHAFLHGALRLNNSDDIGALQSTLTATLTPLTQLETDSQAARYEGPEGSGRIRASHVLTRRTSRLLAILHALQQLLRYHGDRLPAETRQLARDMAEGLRLSAEGQGVSQARERLLQLRHRALKCVERGIDKGGPCRGAVDGTSLNTSASTSGVTSSPPSGPAGEHLDPATTGDRDGAEALLQLRLNMGMREALGHALVILDAREAIHTPGKRRLKAPALAWHRDHLAAALNGLRAGLVFALLATFWRYTAWDNGQVAMLVGTLFSAFFATRDNPAMVAATFLKGMLAAIPSAFLFGHVLLAQANDIVTLALVFMPPLFVGLLGAANPRLMGYCLAFTIGNILLTMPGNGMDLTFDGFLNRAIALVIGLSTVVTAFRLLPGLPLAVRKRRLVKATVSDLHRLWQRPPHQAETRFGGTMADRLLSLARHDDALPEQRRYLLSLGLVGLDLGYASLHLRRRLGEQATPIRQALDRFAAALADDYGASARGEPPEHMRATGEQLLEALEQHGNDPVEQRLTAGLIERLTMSLERQAERSRLARER
ncbi:FUSC family protein [Halomonas sp. DP5Y7-2]|uniref:FUSC family protein n=1 Tax=Halomonas sp. DP5Y7-2 TaxID=2859076 RepID=UPI001C9916FB|nr:FUSC family protein [Halomonas sp. DP5Y7-2]MBY5982815.1 FUSC family protein [Halomonas sp. DP5Y7-2]